MRRHLNEQTEQMAKLIAEASQRKGIQWTRVTYFSCAVAVVLFCVVIPALAFWLGMEYEATRALLAGVRF